MTREEALAYGNDYYRDLLSACCEIDIKHKEFVRMALEALEQELILDEIRAEIDLLSDKECCGTTITLYSWEGMKRKVFDIIDKCKAESEG